MNLFKFKKPKKVTRFVGRKSEYNEKSNKLNFTAFYKPNNMELGEISVYNIDNISDKKIFEIGDKKVFKKYGAIARGDLVVEYIEQIKINQEKLLLHYGFGRHCNIKPFPNEVLLAQHISTCLADISIVHLRKR